MAIIRPMTQVEERTLLEWAAVEGWNPGLHDADCFWKLDPDGFLALDLEGQMVGGGAIIRHHDQFGFMGLFIVQPAYRSQKLGTQLWYARRDQLLERLKPASSIGLDAIDAMVPFYARGGFEPLTRHRRFQLIESAGVAACSVVAGEACVDLREVDFAEVVAWDAGCFPGDRHRFVNAWIRQPDAVSLGVVAHGKLAGYGVMRACQIGYKIGPLFARDPSVADRSLGEGPLRSRPERPSSRASLSTDRNSVMDMQSRNLRGNQFLTARGSQSSRASLLFQRRIGSGAGDITGFSLN